MSVVAALLIALAVTEVPWLRPRPAQASGRGGPLPWAASAAGIVSVLAVLALTGDWSVGRVVLGLVAVATVLWWLHTAHRTAAGPGSPRGALLVLGVGCAILLAFAGHDTPSGGVLRSWLSHAAPPRLSTADPDRVLMTLAVAVAQLGPANRIVRLVLTVTGTLRPPGQPQASDALRGGRVLGPLERLLILSLALAGQVTAAGFVTAAKGLIRFPELTAQRGRGEINGVGIDAVTEYFLIGSFVSWALALGGVGLVALA